MWALLRFISGVAVQAARPYLRGCLFPELLAILALQVSGFYGLLMAVIWY
jgi:hypothetical protein